jgi:hypothetical protein
MRHTVRVFAMKNALRFLLVLMAGSVLSGCAIHTKEQIAAVRSAGVSAGTVRKLEGRGVLTPDDIIELRKRRVDDGLVIEHLDKVGVDYALEKDDIKAMRSAGVRSAVINAVIRANNRFLSYLNAPQPYYYYSFGYWDYPFYSPFYPRYYWGPWGYYGHPGFGLGYRRWR